MYLRVTRGHIDPAKSEEAIGLVPALIAAIKQLPGCQDVQTGVDRATGKSISIGSFDTLEQAQFSREGLGDAMAQLIALGWQGEAPEFYEKAQ